MKRQYKSVLVTNLEGLDEVMNGLGAERWQLEHLLETNQGWLLVFMREVGP